MTGVQTCALPIFIVDNAGPSVSSPSISVENTADSGTTWNPGAKNLYVSGTQVWAGAATGVGIPSSQRVKLVYTITERNTGPPALSTGAGYEAFTCPTAPTGLQAAKISFTYGGASTSEVANSSAVTYPSPASKNGSSSSNAGSDLTAITVTCTYLGNGPTLPSTSAVTPTSTTVVDAVDNSSTWAAGWTLRGDATVPSAGAFTAPTATVSLGGSATDFTLAWNTSTDSGATNSGFGGNVVNSVVYNGYELRLGTATLTPSTGACGSYTYGSYGAIQATASVPLRALLGGVDPADGACYQVQVRSSDNVGNTSVVTSVDIRSDRTAPTLAFARSSSNPTNSTALTYTLTATGSVLDCSTISTTGGTDFDLTGISSIGSITGSDTTICSIPMTSSIGTSTAGLSTVAKAATFSVADMYGNTVTSVTGLPRATVVDRIAPAFSAFTSVSTTPATGFPTYTLVFADNVVAGSDPTYVETLSGLDGGDFTNAGTATSCVFTAKVGTTTLEIGRAHV